MPPTHLNAGLSSNDESRGVLCWLTDLVCIADVRVRCDPMPGQSASGLVTPHALGPGPRVVSRKGGVVLCFCESGSGASLGACDQSQSVRAGGDPVVRLDCLTGNVVVSLHGKPGNHAKDTPPVGDEGSEALCEDETILWFSEDGFCAWCEPGNRFGYRV